MAQPGTSALKRLRRHRRPFAWLAAALVVVSLGVALGQCLAMGSMRLLGAAAADTGGYPMVPGDMPCADCTAGGDKTLPGPEAASLRTDPEPAAVLAPVLASPLLALAFPKIIPIPRRPFLPARSRTLKFCVLRI